jgi:hypothetical protein
MMVILLGELVRCNYYKGEQMKVKKFYIVGEILSKTLRKRWYSILRQFAVHVHTETGIILVIFHPGFELDGRSGGRWIDWLFPNWGNQMERACVAVHDALYYDFGISFESANQILHDMIILSGKSKWRADWVLRGVSTKFARKHFGNNTKGEDENKKLVSVQWLDRV